MEKEISIQIHDYDSCGRYVITEDRKGTLLEAQELKAAAHDSVKVEWWKLPREVTHVVYYAEMMDANGEVWFVAIYMHGEAFNETDFERIFHQPNIGYVGAIHKRV